MTARIGHDGAPCAKNVFAIADRRNRTMVIATQQARGSYSCIINETQGSSLWTVVA